MAVESNFGGFAFPRGPAAYRDDDATVELYPDTMQFELESLPDTPQAGGAPVPRLPILAVERRHADTARQDVDPFQIGATLRDRYRIESVIGRGGCAIIFRARDLRCEDASSELAHVAIKALRPELRTSGPAVARLRRGFRGLRLFTHPNVVRVFDLDSHKGHWFEVMELLEGETLARHLHRRLGTLLAEEAALDILSVGADALAAAHRHGVVHGDIKPGNFFLLRSGELRLLDFGGESAHGERGPILATPAYASPEVLSGMAPEPRDDIFSLACVACELLTGSHPFGRVDAQSALHRGAQPVISPALSPARAAALASGLAARREDRPTDVRALIDALKPPRATVATAAAAAGTGVPARHRRRRMPLALAALSVLAIVLSAAQFVLYDPAAPAAVVAPRADHRAVARPASPAPVPAGGPDDRAVAIHSLAASTTRLARPTVVRAPLAERQRLSFSTPGMTVSAAANLAALPVRRTGPATGSARLSWRISEPTAAAGRDFSGPMSGVVRFADGQLASTIFIPVMPGQDGTLAREFTVMLEPADGPVGIGDIDRITVRLR